MYRNHSSRSRRTMKSNNIFRIISIVISIPAIIVLSSCSSSTSNTPATTTTTTTAATTVAPATRVISSIVAVTESPSVDESYNGKEIQLAQGSILQVALNSNPTTGFKWELIQISDSTVLEKVSDKFETPMIKQKEGSPPIVGAGGKEFWQFKALKKGTAAISMEYSRPWEGGEKGVNKFNLTVVVQ
jgi:inhibitor of cysteine peptidase